MSKILFDSKDAAKEVTKTWWCSSKGNYYAKEAYARYDGCTHNYCDCGQEKEKKYSICKNCRSAKERDMFNKLEIREWDENGLANIYRDDRYFQSWSEVEDYCLEHDIKVKDLMLVISEPAYFQEVDPDEIYSDLRLEDVDNIPSEIRDAFDVLNNVVKNIKIVACYFPGDKVAVKIPKEYNHD